MVPSRAAVLLCLAWPMAASAEGPPPAEARVAAHFETLRHEPPQLVAFLRAMPKGGDLHSHLSGAIYAERLIDWAAEDGRCVDTATLAVVGDAPCDGPAGRVPASEAHKDPGLYRRLVDAWSMRNQERGAVSGHDQFFDAFRRFSGATPRSRTGDMIADIARRAARSNVSYLELIFSPDGALSTQVGGGVAWNDDVAAMRAAVLAAGVDRSASTAKRLLDEAESRARTLMRCGTPDADPGCAVTVRYQFQVLRGFPREQVFAQMVGAFETASQDARVTGPNLVMPEDWLVPRRDFALHVRLLDALRKLYPAVRYSLHAGELWPGLVPPDDLRHHVRDSIRLGGARRIGHGTDVMFEDEPHALLREMAEAGIPVEISLYSSDGILGVRGREHPLRTYLAAGVPVVLVTDDEGVSRSDLTLEYVRAAREHDLSYAQLKRIARASLEHALVDDATRARLLAAHDAATARFESALLARVEQPGGAAHP